LTALTDFLYYKKWVVADSDHPSAARHPCLSKERKFYSSDRITYVVALGHVPDDLLLTG